MWKRVYLFLFVFGLSVQSFGWGFYAHKKLNRQAVFSLPPEMIGFYKAHLDFISENAVNPDRRRYAVMGEAEKHFIDIDAYGDSAQYKLPRYWQEALELFTEEELRQHGIGPWNVYRVKLQLTEAFRKKDVKAILRLSADIGHYIGDMHVPLHTTKNYNGQLTDQYGIHPFWESRIPELLSDEYDFFVGKAAYVERPQIRIWDAVIIAHNAVDSVLSFERELSERWSEDKKYTYEERGGISVHTYSRNFTESYHELLGGQVERQMKSTIKMIADFWFTAWVDAGQPNLLDLLKNPIELPEEKIEFSKPLNVREHEGLSFIDDSIQDEKSHFMLYAKLEEELMNA